MENTGQINAILEALKNKYVGTKPCEFSLVKKPDGSLFFCWRDAVTQHLIFEQKITDPSQLRFIEIYQFIQSFPEITD